ncbi:MAG: sigma 54-interacting transcriptional regulator [Desulfomonilaceae bacterium]
MVDEMDSEGALRSFAENIINKSPNGIQELKDKQPESIIHELHVHQVELEIQNEELRRTHLELELSRDRYRDLYDFSPIGYFTLDMNSRILEANITGASLLGIEKLSLINKKLTRFIHKDDQDTFYLHRKLVLETQTRQICELRMLKSQGVWLHVQLQSFAVRNPDGEATQFWTALSDISELVLAREKLRRSHDELELKLKERTSGLLTIKEKLEQEIEEREVAQRALKLSEQRLHLVLTGAGLGSWDFNIQVGEAFLDERVAEILGVSVEELQTTFPWIESLTHPEDWPRVSEIWNEHIEGRRSSYEAEFRVKPGLGSWKWVLARGSVVERDENGTPLRISGTYLDITERKHAEEVLRISEERFRALFEGSRDMIFVMDDQLRYTDVNPAMAIFHGLKESEFTGRTAKDIYGKEVGQELRGLDQRVLRGETIEREHSVRIKDTSLVLNTVLRPLRDNSGKVIGVFGVSRDLTDRVKVSSTRKALFEKYPSAVMRATMADARSAATSDGTVLLIGESGSGKDYLARWIHDHSKRSMGPYFSINCAAISRELAESELFGHERGAFTGAHGRKRGLLELAEGGTLLLNEIGELPLNLQSKLLTFLDTKSFLRVGGEKGLKVNARIISATNRNLEKEVEEGRFLAALYYRINVFRINMPPLRDRNEDIPVLLEELMSRLAAQLQLKIIPYIDPASVIALARYDWPGNVRELRNALERSLMLSDGRRLKLSIPSAKDVPLNWSHVSEFPSDERTLHDVTDEVIESLCLEALRRCEGNKRCAARTLGIARDSLYRYMKRFGIVNEDQPKGQPD